MREIKFRAWGTNEQDEGLMMYQEDNIIKVPNKFMGMGADFNANPLQLQDWKGFTLMQYTGLKDKNGVEIYEGDIVKGAYLGLPIKHRIHFTKGSFFYGSLHFDKEYDDKCPELWREVHNVEVVGNIYENPELLYYTKSFTINTNVPEGYEEFRIEGEPK